MSLTPSAPAKWLANELGALLASPHLATSAGGADAFTTRFNAIFMRHARGLVADRELDREGLKQSLLALKKYWDPKKEPRVEDIVLHRCIDGFHVSHPCIG